MREKPKHRFYFENLALAADIGCAALAAAEAHHAANVLRVRSGDIVELFDGKGSYCYGEVTKTTKRKCDVSVNEVFQAEKPEGLQINIASALPKSARQDWMVEKLTELSVSSFFPLHCDHSSVRVSAKRDFYGRWAKLAISASRQCRRYWLPEIFPAVTLDDFLASQSKPPTGQIFLAHCAEDEQVEIKKFADMELVPTADSVTVLIGPEGGWSRRELDLAAELGVRCVSMGSHIMRIETAAIAFAAAILGRSDRS